jgi:hypothetical protein
MNCSVCRQDLTASGGLTVGETALCPGCFARLPELIRLAQERPATPLELATVDELVAELKRRPTFRGVILRQRESFKGRPLDEWRWDANNCDGNQVLSALAGRLRESQ